MFNKAIIANRKRKGFVAVTFAVMATVLIGFSGMAVDAGYMQWNKRRLQMAADAAAMGSLRELEKSHSGDVIINAGRYDASLNGFSNGVNNTTVTISNPPTSGSFSGNNNAVQARIQRTFPTLFMRIFGQNTVNIAATATAHTSTVTGSIGGCIFALNPTMNSSININGSANGNNNFNLNLNCSIVDESNHGSAYSMGGGAVLNMGSGAKVGVVGGWSLGGQSQILNTQNAPATNMSPIRISSPGDPFATMVEPTRTTTGYTSATPIVNKGGFDASAGATLQPGIYCGGINLPSSGNISFAPGIYILAGGTFNAQNANLTLTGTGVMFYLTQSSASWGCVANGANQGYGGVNINGANVNFTAPTTGSFVGMLFFEDRTMTAPTGYSQIAGNGVVTIDGALYFKTQAFKYAGRSSANGYTVVVADNVSINGNTNIGNNYSSLSQPNPFAPYTTGGGLAE